MCLLNVPDVLTQFGPIRNYWEGGMMGEKTLQFAKRTWHGFTANWATNMLRNINNSICAKKTVFDLFSYDQENVLQCGAESDDEIASLISEDDDDDNKAGSNYDRLDYHVYKSTDHVLSLFKSGIPLSIIIIRNEIGIAVKGDFFMSVHVHLKHCRRRIGHSYFTCSIWNTTKRIVRNEEILSYGLLLPMYDSVDMEGSGGKWTIVTSEWQDITSNGDFGHPDALSSNTYNGILS